MAAATATRFRGSARWSPLPIYTDPQSALTHITGITKDRTKHIRNKGLKQTAATFAHEGSSGTTISTPMTTPRTSSPKLSHVRSTRSLQELWEGGHKTEIRIEIRVFGAVDHRFHF